MPRKRLRGDDPGGWGQIVPYGYDFMGPGNKVDMRVPRSWNEVVAKEHDIGYGRLENKGISPKLTWNEEDVWFLNQLKPDDFVSHFARAAFTAKKAAAAVGLIGTSFPYLPWGESIAKTAVGGKKTLGED
jgi:hypothetical protein